VGSISGATAGGESENIAVLQNVSIERNWRHRIHGPSVILTTSRVDMNI